jgi:hypothetical protein
MLLAAAGETMEQRLMHLEAADGRCLFAQDTVKIIVNFPG